MKYSQLDTVKKGDLDHWRVTWTTHKWQFYESSGIVNKYVTSPFTVNGGELGHFLRFFKINFSTIASKAFK